MTLLICECVERPVIQVVVITSHRTQRIDEGDDLVLQVPVVHFFSPPGFAVTERTTHPVTRITHHYGVDRNACEPTPRSAVQPAEQIALAAVPHPPDRARPAANTKCSTVRIGWTTLFDNANSARLGATVT